MNNLFSSTQKPDPRKQNTQKITVDKILKNETSVTKVSVITESNDHQDSVYTEINIVAFKRGLSHLENNYLAR